MDLDNDGRIKLHDFTQVILDFSRASAQFMKIMMAFKALHKNEGCHK
jgi:hypothetical protein